ncbi:MAG: translocation/assembly module TamB domain-containing protein, partial [Candidatus Omnitrophota bacterium]
MSKRRRILVVIFLIVFAAVLLVGLAISFFIFTERGGSFFAKQAMSTFSGGKEIAWQKSEGSLARGLVYENLEAENVERLPRPNKIRIQKLTIDVKSASAQGISLILENARVFLPDSDPIVVFGTLNAGKLDFNLFCKRIATGAIDHFVKVNQLRGVSGTFSDVDVFVKGPLEEPRFEGVFLIEDLAKEGFSVRDSFCQFNLTVKGEDQDRPLFGSVVLQGGILRGAKTAVVNLTEGKFLFSGDPANPALDVRGSSQVEKVKIEIAVKGVLSQPDLQIKSEPPMDKNRLLLALATDKTWKDTELGLQKGAVSPDFARDFIDYFVLGGQASKFTERFGIKSISVQYNGQDRGIAVTKDLSSRLEGKYA